MTRRISLTMVCLAASLLSGQPTQVKTNQLQPNKASAGPMALVWTPKLGFTSAVIDFTTLTLDTSVDPPVFKALGTTGGVGPTGPMGPQGTPGAQGAQGIQGPAGAGSSSNFADAETPIGLVDGNNVVFTLAHVPVGQSLQLHRNGLTLKQPADYILVGATITFGSGVATPLSGDSLIAWYRF